MNNYYITKIRINKVRHLRNIDICLSGSKCKHLILTGKNGSGKTSVLDALALYLESEATIKQAMRNRILAYYRAITQINKYAGRNECSDEYVEEEKVFEDLEQLRGDIQVEFNDTSTSLCSKFSEGKYIIAYYKAERRFKADIPEHIEKVELKDKYSIMEEPRHGFVKYLLDLKFSEALARTGGNTKKADDIRNWFSNLQKLLGKIYEDDSLELIFEEDTYRFFIKEKNREPFDFNAMSSGFAAVLDIVLDIIMRMEKATNRSFDFNIPGIVLIDEIETHLHLEMQKSILKLLTSVFPKIQFIVSTHSPFVLNSLDNTVIYDLENHITVNNGLTNIPYNGVVEGYFKADTMSDLLKEKFARYKELTGKQYLNDDDFEEIADLELYLNEIPDYLAFDITTEYQRVKMEFDHREDIT